MDTVAATAQGRATRARIVAAACGLVAARGVQATSLDDVRAAAGVSKSQLYHYFGDRRGLIEAVVQRQVALVIAANGAALAEVEDWAGLERWTDAVVALLEARAFSLGCPLGTLAAELADTDEDSRLVLADAFESWQTHIAAVLGRLRGAGLLAPDADIPSLTAATLASLQGGLILAKTARRAGPLRAALDAALAHLRASGPGELPG